MDTWLALNFLVIVVFTIILTAVALVSSLPAAYLVWFMCRKIAKFDPTFSMVWWATRWSYLSLVALFIINRVFFAITIGKLIFNDQVMGSIVLGVFVNIVLYARMSKHPDTGMISFPNLVVICLISFIFLIPVLMCVNFGVDYMVVLVGE